MKALRDQFDPYGGRAAGCREMLGSQVAEYGGEMLYINKSAGKPLWAMEYSRDEGLRKYWDEFSPPYHKDGDGPPYRGQDASAYNRNQDSHAIENVRRWYDYWRERPGTGERVSSGGVNIIFSDSNTHFRGAENYRRSGEVDAMRIPKDGYFAHRVMWDGWVDVERPGIYLIGHWNYAPGTRKDVCVVSSADRVELMLNGKSLGMGEPSSRFLYTFKNVEWQPGVLKAVGCDARGKSICATEKKTAGEPTGVRLTVHRGPLGLRADGHDLSLVEVEVVDENGARCPTAMNLIRFSISGPADWRGGIAQGPDNCILSRNLPVECGVNRVLVRSTTTPGKITLNAVADGLKSASVEIVSRAVKVTDGLSLDMPDDGLPSFLERGCTPPSEPLMMTRKPVRIAGAAAGVNPDQIPKTFDDDETTGWSNDGNLATAWIEYRFDQAVLLGEITLKLDGWRQRGYPIRVTSDGQEAFTGVTPRSLGYVTFPLKPVTGRSLRIELTGQAEGWDAYNIVEIAGQKDAQAAGPGRAEAGVNLHILEIEIYGK
jgi:hypothetical protein